MRDRLDLGLASLGLVLLGVGLGGLVSSAVSGFIVDRFGSRRTCIGAQLVIAFGLPAIGAAPTPVLLAGVLVTLGAFDALADIGMNVQASQVDRRTTGSIIQRFHAGWSIGTVLGAGGGSVAAAVGLPLTLQLAITGACLVVLVVVAAPAPEDDPPPARPPPEAERGRGPVFLLLSGSALALAVVEGTPGDWAAVFGSDVHAAGPGAAGAGYLAVVVGMVAGRLLGDRATDRLGGRALFHRALVVTALGATVVVGSPGIAVALVGFVVMGVGISVLFPALYLAAANTAGVPAGLGIGVMTSGARMGFLVGPPAVGAISGASSLRVGFAVVMTIALGAAGVSAGRLSPPRA